MSAAFDRLAGALDPAMLVVTAVAGSERDGCLIGFHAQTSIDPVRYEVRLSKANRTCRVALFAERLGVHALEAGDVDLAELFGEQTGDEVDKLAACALDGDDPPLLAQCRNRFVLRVRSISDDGGDHVAFVGEVVNARSRSAFVPLRLSAVAHLDAGHEATERQDPSDAGTHRAHN